MSELWHSFSPMKCDNISVSTCIRVQLCVIFKSVSVFTAVKGVMFVSGVTDPKWPVQMEWIDPSLVQITDEQWSSSNSLSLPTFLCDRERRHACVCLMLLAIPHCLNCINTNCSYNCRCRCLPTYISVCITFRKEVHKEIIGARQKDVVKTHSLPYG